MTVFSCVLILTSVLGAANALAATLEVAADAPAWAHFGADMLLYLHIGGGTVGLLMGVLAISSRKGALLHRTVGTIFFASMLVTYAIGASVAPFLAEGQRPNFVAGILALYLLITGWHAARRKDRRAGRAEVVGFMIALTITGIALLFMYMGANSPTGTVDGSPPQAFFVFAFGGSAAAAGELNLIMRGDFSDASRVARHLWRMCFSLFIASGSFFLGQPQVFPAWFNATPLPFLLAFSPLVAMAVWLVIVRRGGNSLRFVLGTAH
jgi:hypothetical protein